jgi:Kelch motif/Galactose oxidase, central domain
LYNPTSAKFKATGSLVTARLAAQATLLNSGEVLVTGGQGVLGNPLTAAELYNPNKKKFTSTGSMNAPRTEFTATLLNNGNVLVAGGQEVQGEDITDTAELYKPKTGIFSFTKGTMTSDRYGQTATLLTNGNVLVAGGGIPDDSLLIADLYNPAIQTFTSTGNMSDGHTIGAAVRLCDGRVLVAGGFDNGNTVATADVYDPSTGTFTPTENNMDSPREYFTATLLQNCQVLIVGGVNSNATVLFDTADLFDPVTNTFRLTKGSPITPRWLHTATLVSLQG